MSKGRKKIHRVYVARANLKQRQLADAKKAKREFARNLILTGVAGGLIGGFVNYKYHDMKTEDKKQEIAQIKYDLSVSMRSTVMEMLKSGMANGQGFEGIAKDFMGMNLVELAKDKELMAKLHNRDLSDPRVQKIVTNVLGKMMQNSGDSTFLDEILQKQEEISKLTMEIPKEGKPRENFGMGALVGAPIIPLAIMLYISAKKIKAQVSAVIVAKDAEAKRFAEAMVAEGEAEEHSPVSKGKKRREVTPRHGETASDSCMDSIAKILKNAGVDESTAMKAAAVIVATTPLDEAKKAAVSKKKLLGKLLSEDGMKEELARAGVEIDIVAALKVSKKSQNHGEQPKVKNEVSETNLPEELYVTEGPWQDLATINPRGMKASQLRRLVAKHGFELRGRGKKGRLNIYYGGEEVRSPDGRQVCIITHGDSIGKSHVRAVGKRLALFLWLKNGPGQQKSE
jgi:hypothetical protein